MVYQSIKLKCLVHSADVPLDLIVGLWLHGNIHTGIWKINQIGDKKTSINVDGTNFTKLNNRCMITSPQLNLYWLKHLTPLLL